VTGPGTLELVSRELGTALLPLRRAISSLSELRGLLLRLGWDPQSLPAAYTSLATRLETIAGLVDDLASQADLEKALDLLDEVRALHGALDALTAADAPVTADASVFVEELPRRLFELLVNDYLALVAPLAHRALYAVGILEPELHPATPTRPGYIRPRLTADGLGKTLSNPRAIPERVYGWTTSDFAFDRVIFDARALLVALGLPALIERDDPALAASYRGSPHVVREGVRNRLRIPVLRTAVGATPVELGFLLLELPGTPTDGGGFVIQPEIPAAIGTQQAITPSLMLTVEAGSNIAQTFGIAIRPSGVSLKHPLQQAASVPDLSLGLALHWSPAQPKVLIGRPVGTRLEVVGIRGSFTAQTHAGGAEVALGAELENLAATIALSDQDGFLGKVLGGGDLRVPIPLGFRWSNRSGMRFGASGTLEVVVAPHRQLGPIAVDEVQLVVRSAVEIGKEPTLDLGVGVTLSGQLGPVAFDVERIGVSLALDFAGGNAGPFDLAVGFKPPRGVGLKVDAAVVSGGGFLFLDRERGQYAGIAELSIKDTIQLKAIGILDTKLPGGQPGFSLLLIISAEFPPIQLGYGFTLNGVGGLIGVNRTVHTEALRAGVKTGSLSGVLFPKDPVAHARQIISDLQAAFPPAPDRYAIGPMVKIGWGAPKTLIALELGVVVSFPAPITVLIVGRVLLTLPQPEKPVVLIRMDALGVIEFEKRQASLDATLFDSKLSTFPLTGDMAVRASWGEQPAFALAAGGFNPRFSPPPGFPSLNRLALDLSQGQNPRLRLEAYLAATANTVQFGARAELVAATALWPLGSVSVEGFLAFDVLLQIEPLSLLADLVGGLALKLNGKSKATVTLDLHLTGPGPWHAWGAAALELPVVGKHSFPIEITMGEAAAPAPLEPADVGGQLAAAFADARSWSAGPPSGDDALVSLRKVEPGAGEVLVHPLGELTVRQRVVPLGVEIQRFGPTPPAAGRRFSVTAVKLGQVDATQRAAPVRDQFAPAQFFDMTDDEKLARPSFESMESGRTFAAEAAAHGAGPETNFGYEDIVVDTETKLPQAQPSEYALAAGTFGALAQQGSAADALLDRAHRYGGPSQGIGLSEPAYVAAGVSDLALEAAAGARPAARLSLTEASQRADSYVTANPQRDGQVQVVPAYELSAA
jgi:hypothetical protein